MFWMFLKRDSLIFIPGFSLELGRFLLLLKVTIFWGRMSNQHLRYINASIYVFMVYLLPGMVGKTSAEAKIWIYRNTIPLAVKDRLRLEKTDVMLYKIHHRNKNKKQILWGFLLSYFPVNCMFYVLKRLCLYHEVCWLLLEVRISSNIWTNLNSSFQN